MVELILFGSLAVMIFINIPIAIGLGLASIATLIYVGSPLGVVPSMMQATVQKFALLTIPLFILAGAIMNFILAFILLILLMSVSRVSTWRSWLCSGNCCYVFCSNFWFRNSYSSSYGVYFNSCYGKTRV